MSPLTLANTGAACIRRRRSNASRPARVAVYQPAAAAGADSDGATVAVYDVALDPTGAAIGAELVVELVGAPPHVIDVGLGSHGRVWLLTDAGALLHAIASAGTRPPRVGDRGGGGCVRCTYRRH